MRGYICIVALGLLLPISTASAAVFNLADDNSTATFDTSSVNGQVNWFVDGTNNLFAQNFFFRIGSTGGESSVSTLTLDATSGVFGPPSSPTSSLFLLYHGSGFDIEVTYSLSGGVLGSGESDLGEQISIINTGSTPLDFHFFQYVDFDLGGTAGNDYGWFPNDSAVAQAEPGVTVAETVVTPAADHREISLFPSLINQLTDGSPTTLSDTPANFPPGFVFGDVAWGFEWDFVLGAGDEFGISKDKKLTDQPPENGPLVPEPTSLAIWGLGMGALGFVGYKRRKRVAV